MNMSPQQLQDQFQQMSSQMGAQVEQMADAVDRHFDRVHSWLKSSFESSQWIPEAVKPAPSLRSIPQPPMPVGYLERLERWIDQNRAITAAIIAFAGTTTFLLMQGRATRNRRKRRARRVGHLGAKVEAVVLAGPPESPLTRSVAHDLEKRGFLVYIPIESEADEQLVKAEGRADIRPLHLDLSSPASVSASLTAFTDQLATVTRSQRVHLASLVVLPALDSHPSLPLSALSSGFWSSSLYIHLQRPIDLTHAFLPLLHASQQQSVETNNNNNSSNNTSSSIPPTSIVVLSRGISAALPLPNNGTKSVSHAALAAYLRTLKVEIPEFAVSHIQLGAIDLGKQYGSYSRSTTDDGNDESSSDQQLVLHPRSRSSSPTTQETPLATVMSRLGRSADMTPARQLHHAVFDAVTGRTTGTGFVGRGARTYAFVGRYGPVALIRWMTAGGGGVGFGAAAAAKGRTAEGEERGPRGVGRQGTEDWEELRRSAESIGSAVEGDSHLFG